MGVSKRNIPFTLSSGMGKKSSAFFEMENPKSNDEVLKSRDIKVSEIPKHIIKYALTQNPFYYFNSLERFFPNVESLSNFTESKEYLGNLEIAISGTQNRLNNITNDDYLSAIQKLLQTIEIEIKSNLTDYEGSEYINDYVHEVFKDKPINVTKGSERADGQFDVVSEPSWYVYNANYGTIEEKEFVKMFARRFEHLEKQFKDIYLIRNEREIKIIDKQGRAFEPDFLLFCKQKAGEELTYQIFIEPKGKHLKAHDKWKEEYLQEIREDKTTITLNSDKYLITGVPFYNYESENEFKKTLEETLHIES